MKKLGFDLIILGDPASGKDTQAKRLQKKYALSSVESGDYLRTQMKSSSKLGKILRQTIGNGHPAPVKILKHFLERKVRTAPKGKNLLFVGNPRLKPEAQYLKKLLDLSNRDFYAVYLRIPHKEAVQRAKSRVRTAHESSDRYVRNRTQYHKIQVQKTFKYLQTLGKIKAINGNQPIIKVATEIQKAINDYQKSRTIRKA